jgi:hypothetical protein
MLSAGSGIVKTATESGGRSPRSTYPMSSLVSSTYDVSRSPNATKASVKSQHNESERNQSHHLHQNEERSLSLLQQLQRISNSQQSATSTTVQAMRDTEHRLKTGAVATSGDQQTTVTCSDEMKGMHQPTENQTISTSGSPSAENGLQGELLKHSQPTALMPVAPINRTVNEANRETLVRREVSPVRKCCLKVEIWRLLLQMN